MSRNRRHLVIVAVLGLSLLVAGCSSVLSDGGDSSDVDLDGMSAEELQTEAVNASQSVETATFTQELTLDVDSQGSIEMEMDISGAGEEMSISMTMTYDDINEPVDITLPEEAGQADSNY